jgi:hypothetical protein
MNKNKKIVWIVVGIIVLVGVFYGGMVYGKSQIPARTGVAGAFTRGAGDTRGAGGGFIGGQIIAKDATSITVSLPTSGPGSTGTGGSKIIFLNSSTPITKQANGTLADLTIGTEVSVVGTTDANTGSINATSVQIRPKTPITQ